jgi:hypothetical protein
VCCAVCLLWFGLVLAHVCTPRVLRRVPLCGPLRGLHRASDTPRTTELFGFCVGGAPLWVLSLWPRPLAAPLGLRPFWGRACGATPCAGGVPAPGASQRRRRSRDLILFLFQTAYLNKYSAIYSSSGQHHRLRLARGRVLRPRRWDRATRPRPFCRASCALCSVRALPLLAAPSSGLGTRAVCVCVCVRLCLGCLL